VRVHPLVTFLVEWADPIVEYTTLLVSMVCMSPTMGRSMPVQSERQ